MTPLSNASIIAEELKGIDLDKLDPLLPAVLNNCPLAISIKDVNSHYLLANPAGEKLLSVNGKSIIGKTPLDLFSSEVGHAMLAHDRQVVETKRVVEAQYTIEIDALQRTFSSVRFPVLSSTGEVIAVGSVNTDLTTQIAATSALDASENRFLDFATAAADWFWEMDENLRFIYQSERFEEITGIAPEKALGRTREETFAGMIDDPEKWQMAKQLLIARQPYQMEWSIVHEDGNRRILQTTGRPRFASNGVFLGYRGVGRDVTRARQAESERESLISELERKNEELEKFVYSVSHDLKSPLLTIRGFLGLVEKGLDAGDFDTVKTDIARIHSAAANMQDLLHDLLDLTKVGRTSERLEVCPMGELVTDVVQSLSASIDAANAELHIQTDLPSVKGDRKQLTLALQNLLENALRFRGDALPIIQIGCHNERGQATFYVCDNGMGIERRFHEKIFNLFERLDTNDEGTGVGLALTKRIIEHHGGRLWVESKGHNQGSTFFFQIGLDNDAQD